MILNIKPYDLYILFVLLLYTRSAPTPINGYRIDHAIGNTYAGGLKLGLFSISNALIMSIVSTLDNKPTASGTNNHNRLIPILFVLTLALTIMNGYYNIRMHLLGARHQLN